MISIPMKSKTPRNSPSEAHSLQSSPLPSSSLQLHFIEGQMVVADMLMQDFSLLLHKTEVTAIRRLENHVGIWMHFIISK